MAPSRDLSADRIPLDSGGRPLSSAGLWCGSSTRRCYRRRIDGFATPEEAARGDIPARFVQVVGCVVRGDQALVAMLTNDGPPFEVYTEHCSREGDRWVGGSGGNSTGGWIPTGAGLGTAVVWDEVSPGIAAVRIAYRGATYEAPVADGCFFFALDGVTQEDSFFDAPRVVAYVDAAGSETPAPELPPIPEFLRKRIREFLEGDASPESPGINRIE